MKRHAHQEQLIGKHARIIASNNKTLIGIEGDITNETKHTLTINNHMIIKAHATFNIEGAIIKGELIDKEPTERIKVHKP